MNIILTQKGEQEQMHSIEESPIDKNNKIAQYKQPILSAFERLFRLGTRKILRKQSFQNNRLLSKLQRHQIYKERTRQSRIMFDKKKVALLCHYLINIDNYIGNSSEKTQYGSLKNKKPVEQYLNSKQQQNNKKAVNAEQLSVSKEQIQQKIQVKQQLKMHLRKSKRQADQSRFQAANLKQIIEIEQNSIDQLHQYGIQEKCAQVQQEFKEIKKAQTKLQRKKDQKEQLKENSQNIKMQKDQRNRREIYQTRNLNFINRYCPTKQFLARLQKQKIQQEAGFSFVFK